MKKINNSLMLIIAVTVIVLSVSTGVSAQSVPAGCPGGPAGPPSPGTICPDGSIPLKDGSLPLMCPGSSQQGPVGAGYTAECPARPGRSACTYSATSGKCLTTDGTDVTRGDVLSSSGEDNPEDGVGFEADCEVSGGQRLNQDNCGIIKYIVVFTRALSALVGIVVVTMIAVGGIQYAASRDDPSQVSAAKERIRNAILALVFYLFAMAFLQWLVPGGIF